MSCSCSLRPTVTPCPIVFLPSLSNTDEVVLVANLNKTSLAKKKAKSNNAFLTFYQEILLIEWFYTIMLYIIIFVWFVIVIFHFLVKNLWLFASFNKFNGFWCPIFYIALLRLMNLKRCSRAFCWFFSDKKALLYHHICIVFLWN